MFWNDQIYCKLLTQQCGGNAGKEFGGADENCRDKEGAALSDQR